MNQVIIYSTPTCVFCKAAKTFFKENDVMYSEYNVAADLTKRQEMVDKSGQFGVPVIAIGNEIVVGFDKPRLKEILKIK